MTLVHNSVNELSSFHYERKEKKIHGVNIDKVQDIGQESTIKMFGMEREL